MPLDRCNALPKARYIAFTCTPLIKGDELTRWVFGGYVSRYGFQWTVEDGATEPLYYDALGEKLGVATIELSQQIADNLEVFESGDIDIEQRLDYEFRRKYYIITAPKQPNAIAKDFVAHYSIAWESGTAIFVVIDKITAVFSITPCI